MIRDFAKRVLAGGGQVAPLLISPKDSHGLGLLNPSIYIDNGEPWCILRNVNYTEYHTENQQIYNNRWGPLSYLNPEDDLHLRTWNFLCKLNPQTLTVDQYWKIDTSKLDVESLWDFVGLEDARLVRWSGKLYGIGVRRDTTTNGQGRMEFSELHLDKKFNRVMEVGRYRIEHPVNRDWYCEKNWMPILDQPYRFVKFTNPVEVVETNIEPDAKRDPVSNNYLSWRSRDVDEGAVVPNIPFLRGGSQVIPWGQYYICVVHEVDLKQNYLDQKDATYRHRFVTWDRDWNLINITEPISFMGGELEFVCGAAIYQGDLVVGFSVQDNCAFHLRIPADMIPWALGIDTLDWGAFGKVPMVRDYLKYEVIARDVYQQEFKVEEGDTVVDVGASVGPFIWKIMDSKPARVIAVEPNADFLKTLKRNCIVSGLNVEVVEKGVASVDGKFITRGLFDGQRLCNDTWEGDLTEIDGIKFQSLILQKGIERIDFLKIDAEGAEYDVFNDENLPWIKEHVGKIAGEFHLNNKALVQHWLHFRDTYLKELPHWSVYSVDGICITKEVENEQFANHYKAVMVYIDSTPKMKWNKAVCPSLEITTHISALGCVMQCTVCPQELLTEKYTGVQTLSVENFIKLLAKVPKEILISFAGMSEPFINPGCASMIQHAHATGHPISVFTTGVRLGLADLELIKDIPFTGIQGGFVLHLPDVEGHMSRSRGRVPIGMLEAIKDAKLSNFTSMTMGTLPPDLQAMFPDTIQRPLYSRAGNVTHPDVILAVHKMPSTCGCQERLYHNVLLPNGDVVLCCMDYGLQHILGNLYTTDYAECVPEDNAVFELCRHCENGVEVK